MAVRGRLEGTSALRRGWVGLTAEVGGEYSTMSSVGAVYNTKDRSIGILVT